MHISLTPELIDYLEQKIAAGFYSSASEVIRDALRMMKEHDDQMTINTPEEKIKHQLL